jgi:hypothetical protein
VPLNAPKRRKMSLLWCAGGARGARFLAIRQLGHGRRESRLKCLGVDVHRRHRRRVTGQRLKALDVYTCFGQFGDVDGPQRVEIADAILGGVLHTGRQKIDPQHYAINWAVACGLTVGGWPILGVEIGPLLVLCFASIGESIAENGRHV